MRKHRQRKNRRALSVLLALMLVCSLAAGSGFAANASETEDGRGGEVSAVETPDYEVQADSAEVLPGEDGEAVLTGEEAACAEEAEEAAAVDTSAEHTDHTGWTAITGNKPATQTWDGSANYYLSGDATCRIINVTGNVILCLNGYTLTFDASNSYHIVVKDGATLTLCDCSSDESGKITRKNTGGNVTGGAVLVESGGTLIMESGTIGDISTAGMSSGTYSGGGVYVNGGTFTMNGGTISNCTVTGTSIGYGGGAVYVKSGTFTMDGGTITQCGSYDDDDTAYGGAVYVNGGTFALTGGTISECKVTRYGGAVYVNSGTFTMSGGTLTENTAGYGGGAVYSADTVTISGGTICGNTTTGNYGGAGIYADKGTLTISGGLITGNMASAGGGGVYVGSATAEMTGGAINGNTGTTFGGGICLMSGTMTITGGEIKDNVGNSCLGGAVYVDSGTLYLQNVVITDNTASGGGDTSTGGIWNCASGTTKMYLTDGGAVYGNSGYQVYSDEGGTHNWFISAYMLGGGAYNWTDKNGDSVNVYELGTGNIFLKNNPSEDSIKAANDKAEVIISGNSTNLLGGAIAVNGNLIIGTYDLYDIPVRKVWENSETAGSGRPDSITVYLKYMEQDTETGEWNVAGGYIAGAKLNEENNWSYTFEGYELPQGMAFTVEEETLPGYTGYVYGVATENGYEFYIENVLDGSLTVSKTLSGNAAGVYADKEFTFTVTLDNSANSGEKISGTYGDMEFTDGVATFTLKGGESKTATGLPAGVTYEVAESDNEGYDVTVTVDGTVLTAPIEGETAGKASGTVDAVGTSKVVFDNYKDEFVSISGSKTWDDANNQDGIRPESITVNLYAGGEMVESKTVAESDNWAYSFENLPKYANGKEITYTITETAVEGYTTSYNGYDITNSHTPSKTSVTVTKVWDDADNRDGIRPESVIVELLANGEGTGRTLTLSADNNWTGSFTDLDEYTSGERIEYTVWETNVPDGYEVVITGDSSSGFVVTNTHTPEPEPEPDLTEIHGIKIWDDEDDKDGIRPESITVNLYAGGEFVDSVVVIADVDGTWHFTFGNLPAVDENGADIEYSIEEEAVDGYTAEYTGNGYTIVNTHTPEEETEPEPELTTTELTVKKVWTLDDGGEAADSVTVNLLKDGETSETVTLSAAGGWTYTWTGLDGSYTWTVEEADVPDGFTSSVEGEGGVWTITNDDVPEDSDGTGTEGNPNNPDEPDNPDTPSATDNPSGGTGSSGSSGSGSGSTGGSSDSGGPSGSSGSSGSTTSAGTPKTGDESNLTLWISLMILPLFGMTGLAAAYRKTRCRGARKAGCAESHRKR